MAIRDHHPATTNRACHKMSNAKGAASRWRVGNSEPLRRRKPGVERHPSGVLRDVHVQRCAGNMHGERGDELRSQHGRLWILTVKLRAAQKRPGEPRAHNAFQRPGDTTEPHGTLERLLGSAEATRIHRAKSPTAIITAPMPVSMSESCRGAAKVSGRSGPLVGPTKCNHISVGPARVRNNAP